VTQLSPHFTLTELTATSLEEYARANAFEAESYIPSLTTLCVTLLEPVRARFGPVSIHSGFRGITVNAATPGASRTSQHLRGEAADFSCSSAALVDVMRWIVHDSGLHYGQVILEGRHGSPTWIHLSLGQPYRLGSKCMQALTTLDGKTYAPFKG
jgi:zinc D-Ala-D-Ala carboxypeptidase